MNAWQRRAREFAARSDRPRPARRASRSRRSSARSRTTGHRYSTVSVEIDRDARAAPTITMRGPDRDRRRRRSRHRMTRAPDSGCCALARELDDAILHLRANESEIGVARLQDRRAIRRRVLAHDAFLLANRRPLAGARDPALLEARSQAHRSHLALARGAGRARLVLRRHAGRTRVRRRPRRTC